MKCPHCNYEHGYIAETNAVVSGSSGDFYTLSNSVHMERSSYSGYGVEKYLVYGCPSCMKLFMYYY